jgi:hypothetical protein
MAFKFTVLLACVASVAVGVPQQARIDPRTFDLSLGGRTLESSKPVTTPVPILRSLDQQNPDGSYTYGYESGDGTYKIETRYATGEVKGKYGYYDDAGKLREVEYGASPKGGFEPTGEGLVSPQQPIQVAAAPVAQAAAPVVVADSVDLNGRRASVVRRPRPEGGADRRINVAQRRNNNNNNNINNPAPVAFQAPAVQQPIAAPVAAAPRQAAFQTFQPVQPVQQVLTNAERFAGHPASNINLNTGSFSVHYSGRR